MGSEDPEFKSPLAVELIPGGVDSAWHPFEVSKIGTSLLVSCVGVATRPGLDSIAKDTALAAPNALHRVWSHWMDGRINPR